MSFFKNFPLIGYNLKADGLIINITDIFRNADVNDILADSNNSYFWYNINNGDRPDVVSRILYGDSRYYWTFFIINDHLKDGVLDAWPKSSGELERYLEDQYDSYSVIEFYPHPDLALVVTTTTPPTSATLNGIDLHYSATLNGINLYYSATLNGIDLYYEHLRITVTSLNDTYIQAVTASPLTPPKPPPLWVISKYDSNRYQLWINRIDVNSIDARESYSQFKSGSDANNSYTFVLVNNAKPESAEYEQIVATNKAWLETYKAWAKAMWPNDVNVTTAVTTTSSVIRYYSSVKFKSSQTWFTSRGAPIAFQDSSGNNVTFNKAKRSNVSVSEISYATHLIEENDKKSKIRVIPINLIREFSDVYKQTLNK